MKFFGLFVVGILLVLGMVYYQIHKEQSVKPEYLYKVLSPENWEKSQSGEFLVLSDDDKAFIHLSTFEQLERIIDKYWKGSDYVVLKINTDQLQGNLVLEANPGGTNQYYHLYDGKIPLHSITLLR